MPCRRRGAVGPSRAHEFSGRPRFRAGCQAPSRATGGFHAVMNLLFLPLWLLSGAFFPAAGATSWLAGLMVINPLSWCTNAIRDPLVGEPWALSFALAGGFAAAMCAAAVSVVAYPRRRVA